MGKTQQLGTLVNGFAVDANGNVGIGGAANASYKLAVTGASLFSGTIGASDDITITKVSDASFIANNTSASGKSYRLVSKNDGKFYIQNTGVADLVTITSSGNVGIGTSIPAEPLSVSFAAHGLISQHRQSNGVGVGQNFFMKFNDASGSAVNYTGIYADIQANTTGAHSGRMILQVANAGSLLSAITIANNGNVGIGTSSPVGPLDIAVPATGSAIGATNAQQAYDYSRLRIKHYTDSNLGLSIGYAGANQTYIQACYNQGTTAPLSLNPFGGNVGIGTASPGSVLHIVTTVASDNNGHIQYENVNAGTGSATNAQLIGKSRYGTAQMMVWENAGIRLGMRSVANGGTGAIHFTTGNDSVGMTLTGSNLSLNGRFIHQGVSRLCYAGTVAGSGSFSVNLVVGSQSAVKITAAMNHYGYIDGYGCAKMAWVGSNPAFSQIVISEVTSGNGGSWSFTNGGSGIITITKNAGSYGGGGYYFIEVVGNDPQSIS